MSKRRLRELPDLRARAERVCNRDAALVRRYLAVHEALWREVRAKK